MNEQLKFCGACNKFVLDIHNGKCPNCQGALQDMSGQGAADPKKASHNRKTKKSAARKSTGGKGRKGFGRIVLLAACCIGAALLMIAAVTSLTGLFGSNVVATAAQNTTRLLFEELQNQPDLAAYLNSLESLDEKSDRSISLCLSSADAEFSFDMNYAGSKNLSSGTLSCSIPASDARLEADFHGNKKELRLSSPELLTDTYGFTFADFRKKYEKSAIRKVLGLPEDLSLELTPFREFDLKKFLEEQAGDSWKEFEKSLEIEEYNEIDLTLGGAAEQCTVYRIRWDAEKAAKMLKSVMRNTMNLLPSSLMDLTSRIDPDLRCYVNSEDLLVGVDFTIMGSIYTFLLEGADNPWELVSLKVRSVTGTQTYTGGLVCNREGAQLELLANDQTVYAVRYDGTDGSYSMVSPAGETAKGVFQADDSGFHFEYVHDGSTWLYSVSALKAMPAEEDNKYIDLMGLSSGEVTRLVIELCSSLNISPETFGLG